MSGRCPEQLEGPDERIRPRGLTAIEARNFLQNILDNSSDDGNVLLSLVKPPVRSFPVMIYRYILLPV